MAEIYRSYALVRFSSGLLQRHTVHAITKDISLERNCYGICRRFPLVEQDLLTLTEHLNSLPLPVFRGVRVTRSVGLFVDRYLSFCRFSFGHSVVCLLIVNPISGIRPTCLLNLNLLGEHTK